MKLSLIKTKEFANYSGFKSILKTTPKKITNVKNFTLDRKQFILDNKNNQLYGKIIGKAKIQNRNIDNYTTINIREKEQRLNKYINFEHNSNDLFYGVVSSNDNELGLFINLMSKQRAGEGFSGLAKLFDKIAVKRSANTQAKGQVFLYATAGNVDETFALAEPLHWSRGYIDVFYLNCVRPYDEKMKNLFNLYKESRAEGVSIDGAKKAMTLKCQDETTMVLKDEKVKEHLKNTTLLELF